MRGEAPLISIVIPAYNAGAHIEAALRSIADQRGTFETEILVVDDGSTDDTRARAESFAGVRVITQTNAGPSAARNRGVAESSGDLIAFLDADDLWTPEKLQIQLRLLEAQPRAGLAFGDCRRFSGGGERPRTLFEEAGLDEAFWGGPDLVADPYAKLIALNFIPTGSVLLRRSCLEAAGGFDESMRRVEDLDLWLRLALLCPFAYTRHLCQLKREHRGNVSADREAMALAYLGLLAKQRRLYPQELGRRGIRLEPLEALEYRSLGTWREALGDRTGARRWYREALRSQPSWRTILDLSRASLPHRLPWSAST